MASISGAQPTHRRRVRTSAWLLVPLIVSAALVIAADPPAAPPPATDPTMPRPDDFIVAMAGNRKSELEPCGCARNQQGGLDREAIIYRDLIDRGNVVLKIDAGSVTDPLQTDLERLKTKFMFKGLAAMPWHCVHVAATDAFLGEAALKEMSEGIPLFSANVRMKGQTVMPFDAFRVFEITTPRGETFRVGVTGVTGIPSNAISVPLSNGPDTNQIAALPMAKTRMVQLQTNDERDTRTTSAPLQRDPQAPVRTSTQGVPADDPTRPSEAVPSPEVPAFLLLSPESYLYLYQRLFPQDAPGHSGGATFSDRTTSASLTDTATSTSSFFISPGAFNTATDGGDETEYSATIDPFSLIEHYRGTLAKGDGKAPGVRDITQNDAAIARMLKMAAEKLSHLPSESAWDRNGNVIELIAPRAALQAVLPDLRPAVDFLIVCVYDSRSSATSITRDLQVIDFLMTSEIGSISQKMNFINGFASAMSGFDGRMFASIRVNKQTNGTWTKALEMREVASDAPKLEALTAIQDAYREEQRRVAKEIADRDAKRDNVLPKGNEERYVGDASCASCHSEIHAQWSSTPHASAMQTLIDHKSEYNADCISCHVTGHEEISGFVDFSSTPLLANVQCETCHGPGWEHVSSMARAEFYRSTGREDYAKKIEAGVSKQIVRDAGESLCHQCHIEKTGPFDYAERLPFIDHSQPYPEARRHKNEDGAADMMAAFAKSVSTPAPATDAKTD